MHLVLEVNLGILKERSLGLKSCLFEFNLVVRVMQHIAVKMLICLYVVFKVLESRCM